MKKAIINLTAVLIFSLPVLLFSSCKQKGCTDKHALNFNSVADKDDGSCIYCSGTSTPVGSTTVSLIDENSSSPFFGQAVANFTFNQQSIIYPDISCGTDRCTVTLSIQSLVNKTMDIQYQLEGGNMEIEDIEGTVTIGPNQTVNQGNLDSAFVFNPCSTSSFPPNVSAISNIVYH